MVVLPNQRLEASIRTGTGSIPSAGAAIQAMPRSGRAALRRILVTAAAGDGAALVGTAQRVAGPAAATAVEVLGADRDLDTQAFVEDADVTVAAASVARLAHEAGEGGERVGGVALLLGRHREA